jgi:hypothetical protein
MSSMQICYRDPVTRQYVCETSNVYSLTAAPSDSAKKGKPDRAAVEGKALDLMRKFLQANPDDFTITYLAADD